MADVWECIFHEGCLFWGWIREENSYKKKERTVDSRKHMQAEQLITEQKLLSEENCWKYRAVVIAGLGIFALDNTQWSKSMEQSCNVGNRLRSRTCNRLDMLFHPRAVHTPGGQGNGLPGPHQVACEWPWVSQKAIPHLSSDVEGTSTHTEQTKHKHSSRARAATVLNGVPKKSEVWALISQHPWALIPVAVRVGEQWGHKLEVGITASELLKPYRNHTAVSSLLDTAGVPQQQRE